MDGREAVKLLRKGGVRAPIIMLTGHDTDSDAILGLEAGANDYVVKPFRFAVLLARIRAHLRQHEQSEDATFAIGRYTFRPAAKMLLDPAGGKDPADREGDGDPEIPLPGRRPHRDARRAALGGVGLQFRRHHAYAGDAHLPAAAEDRARPLACRAAGDGIGRLQAGALDRWRCRSIPTSRCCGSIPFFEGFSRRASAADRLLGGEPLAAGEAAALRRGPAAAFRLCHRLRHAARRAQGEGHGARWREREIGAGRDPRRAGADPRHARERIGAGGERARASCRSAR